jgi:hypothetical protein
VCRSFDSKAFSWAFAILGKGYFDWSSARLTPSARGTNQNPVSWEAVAIPPDRQQNLHSILAWLPHH